MEGLTKSGELLMTLEIGGASVPARRVVIQEGMSESDALFVQIAVPNDVDFVPLLEQDAKLTITVEGFEVRHFARKLAGAAFLHADDGRLHYELELRPAFWFLVHSMNTRKFRDKTTEEIIDIVLGEEGVPHKWQTRRSANLRPYCVQYREVTRQFVERLLEFEGFYYYFDEDGTMIIADTSSAELQVDGLPVFPLLEGQGAMQNGEFGLTSLVRGAKIGSGAATVNDYNFKTPKANISASSSGAFDADLEVYDYPTGYRDAPTGQVLARLRQEALSCEKRWLEGTSNVPQFAAARIFEATHHEAIVFGGSYLLVRVKHTFERETQGSERIAARPASYENEFFAIPSSVPWRPVPKTPHPVIQGNHTAHVRGPAGEEIHTDIYGRAKVQMHWDREAKGTDEDSRWIRTLQETSSSMVVSRVGWEIIVSYIDGDPDRPIGVGRNINGKMMPTYGQPSRMNMMTIKTETYPGKQGFNELRLDDSSGAMRMDIHAERDFANIVENDKTEKVLNNQLHLVKQGLNRVVGGNQLVSIAANEIKDVQSAFSEAVTGNRNESIGGSEKVKVKVSSMSSTHLNETVKIGSVRFTVAGWGSVSVPAPKYIAQLVVPHTLGVGFDNMLEGGMADGGDNDGHQAGDKSTGGKAGPDGAFGGDGTFSGFGALPNQANGGGSNLLKALGGAPGAAGGPGAVVQSGPNATAATAQSNGGGSGSIVSFIEGLAGKDAVSKGISTIVEKVSGSVPGGKDGALGQALQGAAKGYQEGGTKGAIQQGIGAAVGSFADNVPGGKDGVLGGTITGIASGISSGSSVESTIQQGIGGAVGSFADNVPGGKDGVLGSAITGIAGGIGKGESIGDIAKDGLQGALGSVANQVGGPLGGVIQGVGNSIIGGGDLQGALQSGLQGGIASGIQGALAKAGPVGAALSSALGSSIDGIAGALAKGDFENAMQLGKLGFQGAADKLGADIASFGAAVQDLFKGSIQKTTTKTLTRTIGAAQIVGAGGAIMHGTNYLFTELIGGMKMSVAATGNLMQSSDKFLVHTVGAMILRKSKEDMSMSAKKTIVRVVGATKIHSDEKVELRGKVIEIEGQTSLKLASGDMSIELTPSATTIKGALKLKSGTTIKVSGKPDKLTA
ncbi:MAG: type VI secretion system tip protein TssI/VgrG [Polyangiaceae bacterium]